MKIGPTVNGVSREVDVPAHHTLLSMLRDNLGLTGTKECCSEGECGACTVILDGQAVNSCLVLAPEADGAEIVTIEGIDHPLQRTFLEKGAVQCGFCIPGMIVAAKCMLDANPDPSEADVRKALEGNLCRCAGYKQIVEAVLAAAEASR